MRSPLTFPLVLIVLLLVSTFIAIVADESADSQTSAPAIVVPIHLASDKVHVPVRVGDVDEPVWFLLDSGANMTIFDRALADSRGLELRNPGTTDGAAGGKTFRFAFTEAPPLHVGGLELPARTVAVIERGTQAANGHPSSGLLAADVFRRWVVDVDYEASTLSLHEPDSFRLEGPGLVVLPLEVDTNGKLHVEATLVLTDGRELPARLLVDTGSRGVLALTRPFVERHGLDRAFPDAPRAVVGRGVGGVVEARVARASELRLGGLVVPRPPIEMATPGTKGALASKDRDGILGARFLARHRAVFDVARKRLILEPRGDVVGSPPFDASGLFLASRGDDFRGVEILGVASPSPAAAAGLEDGDRLLTVDGTDVGELGLDGVREILAEPGRTVELRVERDGEARDVRLTTR